MFYLDFINEGLLNVYVVKKHILALKYSTFLYQDDNQTHIFRIPAPTVPASTVSAIAVPTPSVPTPELFEIHVPKSIFLGNRISKCHIAWL